jgi:uncharacterized integral membrane protein
MQLSDSGLNSEIYQGQFGTFTITDRDRQSVVIYRGALMAAAVSFGMGTITVLFQLSQLGTVDPNVFNLVTLLYITFSIGLGIALATIHIYMVFLHRILQLFLAIGSVSAIIFSLYYHQPIGSIIYYHPATILGIGFTFAALTGIFFKEAFCFNRFETKLLVFVVPALLLGHLIKILPQNIEAILLALWAGLFMVFAIRKAIQAIPPDLGDKSVFEYLENQKSIT